MLVCRIVKLFGERGATTMIQIEEQQHKCGAD
jgi:hypothetical protein